jgi:hypothetical protein
MGPKIQPKWIQAYDKIVEVILHGQYSMGRYRDTDGGMSELPLLGAQHIDRIPDVRDGLTREERVVLYVLHETQKERGDRNVPTAMLWGRVCEHFYISPDELSEMLARLGARR